MDFPPELWFEDALENLGEVPGVRSSWFLDRDDNLTLLDEEVVEALQDETVRAVLREVMGLPERERKIVLGIVRQFGEMSGWSWRELSYRMYRPCLRLSLLLAPVPLL